MLLLWQETFAFYGKICTIVKKIHGFDAIFFISVGTEMVRFAKEMTFSYCQKYKIPFQNCNKRTAKTSPFSLLFMTANIFCSNGCKINHIARIIILFFFAAKPQHFDTAANFYETWKHLSHSVVISFLCTFN